VSWLWIISVMTSMLLLFPMTFVSNIFMDPKTMPGFMQTIVSLSPVTHLTDATRGLMHGNVAASDVLWVLIASAIVTAAFAPVAMRLNYSER
jgi:ABC-2 type transport system permease protein